MLSKHKTPIFILFRYILIIIIGLNIGIVYVLFTKPTIIFVSGLLRIFAKTYYSANIIYFNGLSIELIPPCIATSAYYLLFVLILSTPSIKILKRIIFLSSSFVALFLFNSLRIFILILAYQSSAFNILHWLFWVILSTLFVVLDWFIFAKILRIKTIPFYSDLTILKSSI